MKLGKILLTLIILTLSAGLAHAEPSVKRNDNTFVIKEGVTDQILSQIKSEMGEVKAEKLGFYIEKITNDDLAKLCAAYPQTVGLTIEKSDGLTSIAPVAGLKGLRGIKMHETAVVDLSPLAGRKWKKFSLAAILALTLNG